MKLSERFKYNISGCCSCHKNKLFIKCFYIVFAFIFTLLIIRSLFLPNYQPFYGASLLVVFFAMIFIWLLLRYSSKLHFKFKKYQILLVVLFVFITHLIIAFALQVNPIAATWDPQFIYKAAINLSTGNNTYTGVYDYFARYPNNLGLVFILFPWFKIWGWLNIPYDTLALLLNVILLNISLWLLYFSARRLFGEIGSKLALIFGIIFITLSPWVTTFYSDSVGMLFPILILYLYLRFQDTKTKNKWLFFVLTSISIGIGALIKPTVLVIVIAIIIANIVSKIGSYNIKAVKKIILWLLSMLLIISLSFFGARFIMTSMMGIKIDTMPESHYVLIGLKKSCVENTSLCSYGSYNAVDDIKSSTFSSMDEYRAYTYKIIKERIKSYGLIGYLSYLIDKGAWVIGDGTFFAYNEGSTAIAPMGSNFLGVGLIKDILHIKGKYYIINLIFTQSVWFSILFLLLLNIYKRRETCHIMLIIYLSVFGILFFNMIFEARSRYLYLYVPIFILGAVFAINKNILKDGCIGTTGARRLCTRLFCKK